MSERVTAECPACRYLGPAELEEGEPIACPNCGAEAGLAGGAGGKVGQDAGAEVEQDPDSGPPEREVSAEDLLAAQTGIEALLRLAGGDQGHPDLVDTPSRVIRALLEVTCGYGEDPAEILATTFENGGDGSPAYDELVLLRGVRFSSTCMHHLLPFYGVVHVGYIPGSGGRIVGLSKLARLTECYARRLQVQERLSSEIAEALMRHLDAAGAACVVQAHHACLGCRGVRQPDALMVTSSMRGVFREDSAARAEFLALTRV